MTQRSFASQAAGLVGWLAAAFVTGGIGAAASVNASSFYAQLARPAWAPPAGVFGPVWTALFVLIGIAGWLAWRAPGPKRVALSLFFAQLVANALWSWLFFGWHLGALAAVEVLVLLVLIIATVAAFWRLHRVAALLLAPYLAWVAFASALTWAIWLRNPGLL